TICISVAGGIAAAEFLKRPCCAAATFNVTNSTNEAESILFRGMVNFEVSVDHASTGDEARALFPAPVRTPIYGTRRIVLDSRITKQKRRTGARLLTTCSLG